MSIYASINGKILEAVLWIFFGFFADTFDGPVARRLNATSEFGKELDTLCDVTTFGIAPFVLLLTLNTVYSFFYVICAVLRLARFTTIPSPPRRHLGLATPMAAIWVAATVGWGISFTSSIFVFMFNSITIIVAILMVSSRHYHKILAAASLKMRIIDWILWLSVGVILLFWWLFAYAELLIFFVWLICAGYVLFLGAPFLKWDDQGAIAFFQKRKGNNQTYRSQESQ